MKQLKRGTAALLLLIGSASAVQAQNIKGTVTDLQTHEPLIGATIQVKGTNVGAVTDIDGRFAITGLEPGRYTLIVKYVSYQTQEIDGVQATPEAADDMKVTLKADEQKLNEVTVTAVQRRNTEAAMIEVAKNSSVIVSNISAQEIQRTQDANAGEVIRRVPGVSLIDDKFVMVRGLSQRYNNVWVNGGAVPSSEADSRAFSFDMIPSSQLDNLMIIKTPTAEYPADYTGGFILVNTKEIPVTNSFHVSVGGSWNSASAFRNFRSANGSGTDFLGFDNGLRSLHGGIGASLNPIAGTGTDLSGNHLNNNWMVTDSKPLGDLKLSADWNHSWTINNHRLGMLAAVNYSSDYRTYVGMENNLYGVYDVANDRANYLRHSIDDQYNHNVRLGAMYNVTLLSPSGRHKYQFKNIFNQIGNSRYTWRQGVTAQANLERSAEYYYRSRTTYNGQLTGKHTFSGDALDWSVGYAYANRHLPDRKRYLEDDALESGVYALSTGNDISREWTQLDEHIMSANVNDDHTFSFGSWQPHLKMGAYGEYRTRTYNTREFIYNWNVANNDMPADFRHADLPTLLSDASNYGASRLYLLEQVQMRNNYSGHNTLGAAYLSALFPFGKIDVNAGVRYEFNRMELISNTKDNEVSPSSRYYTHGDLFPSINTTYKINDRNQLRLSYGRSVNRPEFREVSSSVYYDFDLASSVQGNTELRNCYIDNLDLRYEFYPSRGEQISVAAFYKHFDSPIEWTYTVAGGTELVYSYKNAQSANTYGLEVDVRKDLSFIGLNHFSWSFNGALIKSRVSFEEGAREHNRPMQGQSPYLINTGIFYKHPTWGLDVSLLYNRIGKRIIGVGRSEGTTGSDENARVPDSYEMPRDAFDLTASKKWGRWEVKCAVRDILNQAVSYKQFADVTYADGSTKKIEEIVRRYKPGRNISVTVTYQF